MAWQHTIYAYPTLFATALSLVLGAHAVRYVRRQGRDATVVAFAAVNAAVAIWTGCSALKLLSTDPVVKFHAYRLLNVGSQLVAPSLLAFALAYTDRRAWLRPRVVVGLFVVPLMYLVLLFTNPYDLAIVEPRLVSVDGLVVWRAETGPAYVVLSFTYVLTLSALTLGVVLYEAVRLGRSYWPQAALLGIAVVTPMTVSFLTSAGVSPFDHDGVNLVPASAAISLAAIGVATVRYKLLDLPPIAYTTAIRHSPDGVVVLDARERVVHANGTAPSLLGQPGTVVGRSIRDVLPTVDVSAATNTPIEVSNDGGGAEYLEVRSSPLRPHEEFVGWVVVVRDVSERRRRERDLEEFTAVVSHDLREPLLTTERYLDLLADRHGNELPADGADLLAVAHSNCLRMQAMIDDLLQYSRVDTADAAFGRVDCDAVVSDVLDALRFEIDDRDVTVVVDDLPTVWGNEDLLGRLFQNLLSNALKHAGTGVTEIRVAADRADGEWRFAVRDDGAGMAPGERERALQLFARGADADPDSGTGVGLALCQKIVDRHGGTIAVDSAPGAGTDVSFTIPDRDAKSRPSTVSSSPP